MEITCIPWHQYYRRSVLLRGRGELLGAGGMLASCRTAWALPAAQQGTVAVPDNRCGQRPKCRRTVTSVLQLVQHLFFFSWTWKEKGDWLYRAITCVREWNEEGRIHQRMRGESTVLATALLDNYGAGPLLLKGKCIHTQYKLNKRRHHWTGNVWKWLP